MKSNNKRHMSDINNFDKMEIRESEANTAISDLISNIKILVNRRDPLIRSIKSPLLLIRGLNDLIGMVEMMDIKYSIVNQIKFLITNEARKQAGVKSTLSNFEGHMLHSVISGNPGTGKTTVAMILSKIWMAMGFVSKKSDTSKIPVVSFDNVNIPLDKYQKTISQLLEINKTNQRKLDHIKSLSMNNNSLSNDIRKKIIKLQNLYKDKSLDKSDKSDKSLDTQWFDIKSSLRELKFGFDELIKEANLNPINSINLSGLPGLPDLSDLQGLSNLPDTVAPDILEDPYVLADPKFIIAAREDLIAEYLGQTAPKTKAVLQSALGGVLFIDEAYSLCNMDGGSKDKYGEECLTTINEFMSLHPEEIIIIFAGYKDRMMDSIFKAQPGLYRRCGWLFEINDYSPMGLSKIFIKQLAKNSWSLAKDVDIVKLISDNKDVIQDGGGGTDKLAYQAKIAYADSKFMETVYEDKDSPVQHDSVINKNMLMIAIDNLRKNFDERMRDNPPPPGMYI